MSFTMLTWNILAPIHVRPERYPRVPPELLDGAARNARILERLRVLDADVIALQEVEPDVAAYLHDGLRDRAYDWRLTLKQQFRLEGVALFVRRSVFGPVRFEEIIYREDVPGVSPTGNVALLAHATFAGRPILLATTHIKWELPEVPLDRHRGLIQVRQLADRLRSGPPAVVSGDFNATTTSPVLAPLWALGLRDPFAALDQPTGTFNGRATRLDFLVHAPELVGTGDRLPTLTGESVLPSVDEPSDHLLLRATLQWSTARGAA